MQREFIILLLVFMLFCSGCATVSTKVEEVEAPATKMQQVEAQKNAATPMAKRYKQKIAIVRFTNETNYGRALFTDNDFDRLGKQASDMLASRLVKSGNFLVFERIDLKKIQQEQTTTGASGLVGVDTVILGSITEFGRSVSGKSGFLSATKVQLAKAKVDIRLVDIKTGQVFYSATGAGEASTESGEIAGYGSRAEYDATLNDRAIAASITDVIDKLVSTLEEKPWHTDVLQVDGQQLFISGGKMQGIKVGDVLRLMEPGKQVKSKQSGFEIRLPSKQIATLKVVSLFGDNESNEGSVCDIISGGVNPVAATSMFVEEVR